MATETESKKTVPWEEGAASKKERGKLGFFGELPILIITALVLALLIKGFLFQAFYIPSGSMEPTLYPGDRVLVNKIPYYFGDPQRGDIVVFENPDPSADTDRGIIGGFVHWVAGGLGVSTNPEEDFIKRVIGVPGDSIRCEGGKVYVNGERVAEPYLDQRTSCEQVKEVPAGMLFVMGDNRRASNDSRFGLGPVPIDRVVGKAFVKIWPPSRMGLLH